MTSCQAFLVSNYTSSVDCRFDTNILTQGLDIAEGSLNYMFEIYKDNLPLYGYLTTAGEMNADACKEFFKKLSVLERFCNRLEAR